MRYDFILVQDSLMRSSFSNDQKSIHNSLLEAELRRLADHSLDGLAGRASSPVLDGNCYFLSVRKGDIQKTVALYGLLTKAKTDQLIADLISAAKATS